MMMNIDEARSLLEAAQVFYGYTGDDDGRDKQTLNMNDAFGWALAWGEYVPDEKLREVSWLFWRYGNAGLLYWVSERNNGMRSEFADANRFIDFVRHEEELINDIPSSTKRGYIKLTYFLGE